MPTSVWVPEPPWDQERIDSLGMVRPGIETWPFIKVTEQAAPPGQSAWCIPVEVDQWEQRLTG